MCLIVSIVIFLGGYVFFSSFIYNYEKAKR